MSGRAGDPFDDAVRGFFQRGRVLAGPKIEARHRHHGEIPAPPPGEHLWTVMGLWRLTDPGAPRLELDVENLLTLEGPLCYVCELPYAQARTGPCSGESMGGGR